MKTTIQISEELRKKLKILASYRDVSYEQILEDFIDMFNSIIPFKSETEFAKWFEKNLDQFGFVRIVKKNLTSFPDYKLKNIDGKIKKVELELIGSDFINHRHDPKKVDLIVCVYSDKNEIKGVPVLSVIEAPKTSEAITERKQRVSLSLDSELIKEIDKDVDGIRVKSRSDAIETILKEYLEREKACVILAGGNPKKLFIKELKTYRPLVNIGERRLIEDIILKCREAGFRNVIIIGFPTIIAKLYETLGNGGKYGVSINYIDERKGLGSAKTLELAKKYLKTDFLFLPCDHWFDFDLKKLQKFHLENNGITTLGIHAKTSFDWKTSIVVLDGCKIVDYEEFPKKPKTHLISVFIGFMKKNIFNYIPSEEVKWSLQENVFPKLAKEKKLVGYPIAGNWVNIHTKKDVEKVREIIKSKA